MAGKSDGRLSGQIRDNSRDANIGTSQAKVVAQVRSAYARAVEKDGQRVFTVIFYRASTERRLAALEQFQNEMALTHIVSWVLEGEDYLLTVTARGAAGL